MQKEDISDDAWRTWGVYKEEHRDHIIREGYYRPLCVGGGNEASSYMSKPLAQ